MERNNIDLSKLERDDLRFLLSTAKDEWVKYVNCKEDVERCESGIEKLKLKIKRSKKERVVSMIFGFFITSPLLTLPFYTDISNMQQSLIIFSAALFGILLLALPYFIIKLTIKKLQKPLNEHEAQLTELQQKEKEAMVKLNKVWDIPDEYCYEYALTKMLRYIDSFKAHSWKEVTTLYDRHIHEQTVEENTRISAEEARKQTEIGIQTRNAARVAAAGAWV
jgi:hypothetical protein